MENAMTKNYKMMENPAGSVRESLDSIRDCVKDLYELDEDNYQMIKKLQAALDKANRRVESLQHAVRANRGKMLLGFLGLGIGIWALAKACENEVRRLQEQIDMLKEQQEKEESEG